MEDIMKSEDMAELKKSLLKDLLKQMDGGIVSSLKTVKSTSSELIVMAGGKKPEKMEDEMKYDMEDKMEGEMEDKMEDKMEYDMEESCKAEPSVEDEEESDIQKKLRYLFSSM